MSSQMGAINPALVDALRKKLGHLEDRVDDLEAENEELRSVIEGVADDVDSIDGELDELQRAAPNGKEGNVKRIVAAAMNKRAPEQPCVTLSLDQLDVATDVTTRRCRQYLTELPEDYAFLHDRREVTQYGEVEIDNDTPGLVVDFDGVHGSTGSLKRFFAGHTEDG